MKIKNNLYFCPWCNKNFEQTIGRTGDGKKGVGVDQAVCKKCGNYVSQKTKLEMKLRMEKGLKC